MNDIIKIQNLEVFANHGVFAEENKLGQKFLVSAELHTDFSRAAAKDDISLSTNYGEVCRSIDNYMKNHTFKLIETAAQGLAEEILNNYPLISGVRVEIKKPWAPVGLPLDTVAVSTECQWHTAYIALGSNMGNKEKYIKDAVSGLSETKGCIVEQVSELIVTKPYGGVGQDDFLNGVLRLKTYLSPTALLKCLHELENKANRIRKIHWGPRTLDLDILLYDSEIIDSEILHIPHIDMQNRTFVLEPLVSISPFVRHPILNKTAEQLLYELKGKHR